MNTWLHTRVNPSCQKPVCIGVGVVAPPLEVLPTDKARVDIDPGINLDLHDP